MYLFVWQLINFINSTKFIYLNVSLYFLLILDKNHQKTFYTIFSCKNPQKYLKTIGTIGKYIYFDQILIKI